MAATSSTGEATASTLGAELIQLKMQIDRMEAHMNNDFATKENLNELLAKLHTKFTTEEFWKGQAEGYITNVATKFNEVTEAAKAQFQTISQVLADADKSYNKMEAKIKEHGEMAAKAHADLNVLHYVFDEIKKIKEIEKAIDALKRSTQQAGGSTLLDPWAQATAAGYTYGPMRVPERSGSAPWVETPVGGAPGIQTRMPDNPGSAPWSMGGAPGNQMRVPDSSGSAPWPMGSAPEGPPTAANQMRAPVGSGSAPWSMGGAPEGPPSNPGQGWPRQDNVMDYSRLFDPKLATNFIYDGRTHAEEWVRKIRNYFLGRCRAMEWMLAWAEKSHEPLNTWSLKAEADRRGEHIDVERVSAETWSFLNSCLQGDGQITFGLVENFNGLEAWRRLTEPVTAQSASKRVALGQQLRNPPMIKHLDDVIPGMERFENVVKDYVLAGGNPPDDEEKASIILPKLPDMIQDKLIFSEHKSYRDIKKYLTEHITRLRNLGLRAGAGTLHALNDHAQDKMQSTVVEALADLPANAEPQDILAVLRKFPNKPFPPRKCFNCGETGHIAAQCPKPKTPGMGGTVGQDMEDRPGGKGDTGRGGDRRDRGRDSGTPEHALPVANQAIWPGTARMVNQDWRLWQTTRHTTSSQSGTRKNGRCQKRQRSRGKESWETSSRTPSTSSKGCNQKRTYLNSPSPSNGRRSSTDHLRTNGHSNSSSASRSASSSSERLSQHRYRFGTGVSAEPA